MNQTNQNQNRTSRFTEVSGGGQGIEFKPHATELNGFFYDPNSPNNILEGYYKSLNEGIPTAFGTMSTASIQKVNPDGTLGEVYSVILDTFLKDKMQSIPLNTYVCLEYKGKTLKKGTPLMGNGQPQMWSKTNSFHTWFVGADYNAIPMNQLHQSAPVANHVNSSNAPGASLNQNPFGNPNQPAPNFPPIPNQQNIPAPNFNQQQNFQQQPVFNTQPTGAQAPFVPPVQNQPQVQQQPYVAPTQQVAQQPYVAPQQQVQAPVQQQQNFQQQPPQFGGQPIQGNPFANDNLPF